jgi:hypothetical protein
MTIAANLSRKLYDTLGDEAAEAMVDWMQRVDTQRSELRELNDLSFACIDARIAAAIAELREKLAYADLLKWQFVFWATAMIALFLRTR